MNTKRTESFWFKAGFVNAAIVLFNAVLIGVMWSTVFEVVLTERQATIRAAIDKNNNLARVFEQYTLRTIESAEAVIQYLIREYGRRSGAMDLAKFVADYSIEIRSFTRILLVDEHGAGVASSVGQGVQPINVGDREYFTVHRGSDSGTVIVTKPVTGRLTGTTVIPISRRINKPDGTFGGVAVVFIEPSRLTDFLYDAKLRPLDIMTLIGLDGISRARLKGTTTSSEEYVSGGRHFLEHAKQPAGNYFTAGHFDDIPKYFSYRTLPRYRLMTVVGTAEADVLAEFHRRRSRYFAAAGLVTVTISGFAILLMLALARQRRMNADIARGQARFLATFNQAAVGISHTGLDGRFIDVNRRLCDIFGYSKAEMLRRTVAELTHPEDIAANIEARRHLLEEGGESTSVILEKRYLRKGGAIVWCRLALALVSDPAGHPEYFAAVTEDITERKQAEVALRDYAEEMRHLSQRLSEVEEAERRNINRELHDRIGPNLVALKLNFQMLRSRLPMELLGVVGVQLEDAQNILDATNILLRNVMADLRPPALDDYGLTAALRTYVELYAPRAGIPVNVLGGDITPRPSLAVETALFRIAQEALNNVVKHARARQVDIAVNASAEGIILTITDDGAGFAIERAAPKQGSWGLKTMRERALAIGAVFYLESVPGNGTRIRVELMREAL